jgi:hypothetical protein
MTANGNQSVARTYAVAGVPVFPCRETGERAKSPYVANGYHQANAHPDLLKHWAAMHPNAIYGLSCAPNGLFVLDADRHGNGDGVANVMSVFARHGFDWQSVPVVQTPGDGLHFIFQKPAGLAKTKGKIAEAVDVRDNGYIIAPGNILPDGRRYALVNGSTEQLAAAIASRSLPLMPEWLVAAALQPYRAPAPFKAATNAEAVTNQLRGLVQAVIGAPSGNRNRLLYWAACRLGGFVSQGIVGGDAALALLIEAGQQAGLGIGESTATALSGLRQGQMDAAHGC